MISKRIIPTFLLSGNRLVKGTNFRDYIDVGDPISQSMIYDAQGADEIVILDILASSENRTINTSLIEQIIYKCRLPISAGGGIKTIDDAKKIFKAGADKIVVNTHAILNPSFIKELSNEFGSQSVVLSIDVKKNNDIYDIYIYSGKKKVDILLEDLIKSIISNGAGEIIINSIDRDGTLKGFDIELYKSIMDIVKVPLIASGGAGSYDNIVELFEETKLEGCGIGKMLFLRDYDIVRIKSYLKGKKISVRDS